VTGPAPLQVVTERLLLRRWRDEDRAPFAELNADPAVMEHFPALLTREESDAMVDRIGTTFDEHGFGLWAAEVQETGAFIGFIGLWPTPPTLAFSPAVEVGWRLAQESWGHGYAPEGARASIADGFARLEIDEIVSMTSTTNLKSQRVMQKLGMTRDPADDFDHPMVPEGHRLRAHVLYRLGRP
jgi:ribosomal-protein-alanine N-acetyltransferase